MSNCVELKPLPGIEGNIDYAKAIKADVVALWDRVGQIRERNSGIDPRSPQSATTVIGELNIAHAKVLAGSNLKNSRLGEIKPTTLLALFRLYPALKLRAEEHDPTDPQTAILPPIERLEEIELCDFVGALSVAAIANWMPYRGTGSRLGIRVHPLNDPELIIACFKPL